MSRSGADPVAGAHHFHPSILREYDIRGITGQTLTEADAQAVGRALGTVVARDGGRTVAIGYDGRLSSPSLADAAVDGAKACGLEVVRTGLGPTPMLYFAVKDLGLDAGIQITGSHNPPEYNGLKMMRARGSVFGDQIQELGRLAAAADYALGEGSERTVEIQGRYVDRLLRDARCRRPLAVVWDAGNGATGAALRDLVARLPGRHHLLYDQIDGRFPNHHPDPTVEANLVDLKAAVRDRGADLGIAFDGDGDRIGVVDEGGHVLWADQLLALYAEEVLAAHPGAAIIADVKSSQTAFEEIRRLGGVPVMWKTGHSLIKAKMAELAAPLSGEMSGHIFFGHNWYGFDDALYCAVRLLDLIADGDQPLSAYRARFPAVVNTPEIRFPVEEARKFAVVEEIRDQLAADAQAGDVSTIDGVRVTTPDGWWLLRASNTQDVLVARAESTSQAGLRRLKAQMAAVLTAASVPVPEF